MKHLLLWRQKTLLFYFFIASSLILSGCDPNLEIYADRGATTVKQDHFGDSYTRIQYLQQGWDSVDSLWFYTTTIGSNLMPYDFFMALEKPKTAELFRSDNNMNFYRYLPQKTTSTNPDALPVGWVKDIYKGKEYIGLTCAACHTGQINYNGTGIRIDGGPAAADMQNVITDIAKALKYTSGNEEARNRFFKNVLAQNNYTSEVDVMADLNRYTRRLISYIEINRISKNVHGKFSFGYGRWDAFGIISNRVLENLINEYALMDLWENGKIMADETKTEDESREEFQQVLQIIDRVKTDNNVIERMTPELNVWQLSRLRETFFNQSNAPVSYPFLWDTVQHDYVHWNGSADNAGIGALRRNAEKVIGVLGTLEWGNADQELTSRKTYFTSSMDFNNLRSIEDHLTKLKSPEWPEDILGSIDRERAYRGKFLFNTYCASCHVSIDRADPERRVVAHIIRASDVETDPKMAANSIDAQGYSGILRNKYVDLGMSNILINQKAPVVALLKAATLEMLASPDPDMSFFQRWFHWLKGTARLFDSVQFQHTLKQGIYNSDTSGNPIASLRSYKARSLNGIWSTAPYLHNGSVPTLYDLLLPKKREGDPEDGEYRPEKFQVGTREFDPFKVGFKSSGYEGFTFDTTIEGNSNAGHEYASGNSAQLDGKTLRALTKEGRLDLLEYLKTL